ncbi:MAG: hypothetical protein ACLGI6_22930 [Gammaproteobacteria bacterium]
MRALSIFSALSLLCSLSIPLSAAAQAQSAPEAKPAAAAPAATPATPALSAEQIDRYVGNFAGNMPPLQFRRVGANLMTYYEGKMRLLEPIGPHTFKNDEYEAELEFKVTDAGPASGVVVRQRGREIGYGQRVD